MEESVVRDKLRDIILDKGYESSIDMTRDEYNSVLASCVSLMDVDWLFDRKILDNIIRFVISGEIVDAMALAKDIKDALANYYDIHIEELFYGVLAEIDQDESAES